MSFCNLSFRTRSDIVEVTLDGIWLERHGRVCFQYFSEFIDFSGVSVGEIYNIPALTAAFTDDPAFFSEPEETETTEPLVAINIANQGVS